MIQCELVNFVDPAQHTPPPSSTTSPPGRPGEDRVPPHRVTFIEGSITDLDLLAEAFPGADGIPAIPSAPRSPRTRRT